MDHEALDRLSREEPRELLVQQAEVIGRQQAELAEREAAIERRDEKVRGLGEGPARFRRPVKTPENSSAPPSRSQKANRVAGRRREPGPKRGHAGSGRVRSEPDAVVECRPRTRAGRGQGLPRPGGRRTGRSQVIERPVVAPVVIEAWQYTVACERCGEQPAGAYPAGLEPHRASGPGVEALLSYVRERQHVSYERLVEACRDVFGLALSRGGAENAPRRPVERARPTYAAIRERVRGSPGIDSDATSARVAGRTRWHRVFRTPEPSYHVSAPGRGGEVIAAFPAGAEPEARGSDRRAPPILTPATEHQLCLSHRERDPRPSVFHRKVIGGSRSARGADASAIRTTILATARKQGHNLLDAFRAVAGPSPLLPIPARS